MPPAPVKPTNSEEAPPQSPSHQPTSKSPGLADSEEDEVQKADKDSESFKILTKVSNRSNASGHAATGSNSNKGDSDSVDSYLEDESLDNSTESDDRDERRSFEEQT